MHTLSSLAPELLLEIADYLLLPDLHSFVHTRLCFSRTLQPPFRYHHALKQRYRALDGPPDDEPLGWMGVLLKVLRGELPASYIEEVKINTVEWYWNELKAWRAGTQLNAADYRLVETQARRSPWIHESDACGPLAKARSMQEFLLEVREGDQDVSRVRLDIPHSKANNLRSEHSSHPSTPSSEPSHVDRSTDHRRQRFLGQCPRRGLPHCHCRIQQPLKLPFQPPIPALARDQGPAC